MTSQGFDLFSQTVRLDQQLPQAHLGERKTIPLFNQFESVSLSNKALPDQSKAFIFSFARPKKFEEPVEEISLSRRRLDNSRIHAKTKEKKTQVQRPLNSVIIKPRIKNVKQNKKKEKATKKGLKTQKVDSEKAPNISSKLNNTTIVNAINEENSSQTSVDESEEDKKDLDNSCLVIQSNSQVNVHEKINFNFEPVSILKFEEVQGNFANVNIVLLLIKVLKLVESPGTKPYALFLIKGNEVKNILHFEEEKYETISGLMFKKDFRECKLIQRTFCVNKLKINTYTFIDIFQG